MKASILCLMGPTASGKSALAMKLAQHLHTEIISVDSAMVYRGMDIGTAKPSPHEQQVIPHHLIDICDPNEVYSAGQFLRDAEKAIQSITAQGKLPMLVGGTMMYFRALQQGLANLPPANMELRKELEDRGNKEGWANLHDELKRIDPTSANRIHLHDAKRIQRALEVFILTGKSLSTLQENNPQLLSAFTVLNIAIAPQERQQLHALIASRFHYMLKQGLIDEVKKLYDRGDLNEHLPSIRSVNYRQIWAYLEGKISYEEMCFKAVAATRQLAKRQLTWLRSWPKLQWFNHDAAIQDIIAWIENQGRQCSQ